MTCDENKERIADSFQSLSNPLTVISFYSFEANIDYVYSEQNEFCLGNSSELSYTYQAP